MKRLLTLFRDGVSSLTVAAASPRRSGCAGRFFGAKTTDNRASDRPAAGEVVFHIPPIVIAAAGMSPGEVERITVLLIAQARSTARYAVRSDDLRQLFEQGHSARSMLPTSKRGGAQ